MERRHFLKLALGFAAGGVALAASAQAAPLMPAPLNEDAKLPADTDAQPAVTTGDLDLPVGLGGDVAIPDDDLDDVVLTRRHFSSVTERRRTAAPFGRMK